MQASYHTAIDGAGNRDMTCVCEGVVCGDCAECGCKCRCAPVTDRWEFNRDCDKIMSERVEVVPPNVCERCGRLADHPVGSSACKRITIQTGDDWDDLADRQQRDPDDCESCQ